MTDILFLVKCLQKLLTSESDTNYFFNTCIQAYEKGFKPKGTIFPCGYEVNANVDETMAERLKNLAKMMGMVILQLFEDVN